MPVTGPSGQAARRSARSSTTSCTENPSRQTQQQERRAEKAKSSQPYVRPSRSESLANATGSSSSSTQQAPQRPGLKNRANSAPLAPGANRLPGSASNQHGVDIKAQSSQQLHRQPSSGEPGDDADVDNHEIAEDPFFQRYNVLQPPAAPAAPAAGDGSSDEDEEEDEDKESESSSEAENSSDTEGPLPSEHLEGNSRPSLRSSERVGYTLYINHYPKTKTPDEIQSTEAIPRNNMQEINIGVLGAAGVGKTTFVHKALELRSAPLTSAATKKLSLDGSTYVVRLIELQLDDLDIDDNEPLQWPSTIDDDMTMPRIDGALTLYDVMDKDSLGQVPGALNQLKPAAATATEAAAARKRANSSAVRTSSPAPFIRKHERASSEWSGARLKKQPSARDEDAQSRFPESARSRSHHPSNTPQQSFLDLEESPTSESQDSERHSSPGPDAQDVVSGPPSDENGYTFDQLVDRLLAQPLSKQDSKFAAIFLALYRKFAAPRQLLEAIITRFEALEDDKAIQMIRTVAQLRHLAIIEQWISLYPGDFAHSGTRHRMTEFINKLTGDRIFSVAAREMAMDLEVVVEDDDTNWACSDMRRERQQVSRQRSETFLSAASTLGGNPDDEDSVGTVATKSATAAADSDSEQTLVNPSVGSRSTSSSASASSSQTMLDAVEAAQRQAKLLVAIPRMSLTKIQWHQVMNESEESLARELTRMDWIMFSSIRPRDLDRHVSLKKEEQKKYRSLMNVNRMIEHFNHLAYWVANFVLLRDKPKHRALMLEKFMKVARKLRELNNYNALGAILAGINGTAVHRLAATRDLVPATTAKDFMKLEILMSTQKSHFAYRLAWENSSGERIPYLPLHRRDLVSASEGNPTFIGGVKGEEPNTGVTGRERINWKKFDIMGEVIVGMQRAQGTPYPALPRNEDVKQLVLDLRIVKDDDDLYERSRQVEPSASSANDRKRFINWFQR
ncbi:hypothetical protein H2201_004936 [Coniosporium apollinis]|uniref:Ras-GEF domain-containing protein n=1 Tax=Coniosporium apollinis TaxID=61459 RepID=A0ABQ9NR21_9PEZI|nr:hypothetical protein H2201_004936 [Coniosporium apollinis]